MDIIYIIRAWVTQVYPFVETVQVRFVHYHAHKFYNKKEMLNHYPTVTPGEGWRWAEVQRQGECQNVNVVGSGWWAGRIY